MSNDTIIEAMARAICRQIYVKRMQQYSAMSLDRHVELNWRNHFFDAQAAYDALIEGGNGVLPLQPTSEMMSAGAAATNRFVGVGDAYDIYRAMVSTFLEGREGGKGASGGREAGHGALPMPTEPPLSAGSKPPSDHLVICIPTVESGMEVTVEAFPGDSGAASDAFLAAQAKGWYGDIVSVYRHHGKGPLDNKWWGGMWTGYGKRHEAWKLANPTDHQGEG